MDRIALSGRVDSFCTVHFAEPSDPERVFGFVISPRLFDSFRLWGGGRGVFPGGAPGRLRGVRFGGNRSRGKIGSPR